MDAVEVANPRYRRPDGRELFADVSFRVAAGSVVARAGENGAGEATLPWTLSGELPPVEGGVRVHGGLGVMPRFVGSVGDASTVRDLLLAVAPAPARRAAAELAAAELALMDTDDEATQLRYASALVAWGEVGGYDLDVLWDTVTVAAWSASARRCSCWTSGRTASTWRPRRRRGTRWRGTTARCWRSRTTAGSRARSTGTWSSAGTARCPKWINRGGTSRAWRPGVGRRR